MCKLGVRLRDARVEEFAHGKNAREELRRVAKLFPTKFRYARFLACSAINFPVFLAG